MSNITISNHQPQDIQIQQNENQLIFVNGGGEVIGITDVKVNGTSVVTNNIAYVIVPTKTSELQNNSGFLTSETDPTVPSIVKTISQADIINWNNKQNALVSGTNIKTINNESLLGSGNINIEGNTYTAGTGIDITNNVISNEITSYNDLTDLPTIPEKVSDLINDLDFVSENELSEVAFTGSYASLSNVPTIPESTSELINDSNFVTSSEVSTEIQTAISTKQDTLVSGTNIKTVNNNSLLGSGNISISGGNATDVQINGTSIVNNDVANIITESTYNSSTNKIATINDIPTTTSELTNDSNFAVTNANNNFSANQTFNDGITTNNTTNLQRIEIYPSSGTNTPYIDFHYGNSSADYTSRIIEIASGQLQMENNLKVIGYIQSNNIVNIGVNVTFSGYGGSVSNTDLGVDDCTKYIWIPTTSQWEYMYKVTAINTNSLSVVGWQLTGTTSATLNLMNNITTAVGFIGIRKEI